MFIVLLDEEKLTSHVHALVKAFYVDEEVKVVPLSNSLEEPSLSIFMHIEKPTLIFHKEKKEFSLVGHTRTTIKKYLYEVLSQITGKTLPWGDLIGIRPTKLAMKIMEENGSKEDVFDFFLKDHYVSEEKTKLCYDIANREKEILAPIQYKGGYSLYIGIPFCPTTCLYCSFTSYPICSYRELVDTYIDCLLKEMEFVSKECKGKVLNTVYIGGGTPTTLEPHQLKRIIDHLYRCFDIASAKEFSVEAGRPDSITREKLEVLYEGGVTRISVNPQTMNQKTLDFIGRKHTTEQVKEVFHLARSVGFDNINMDLILGLPNESEAEVIHTMNEIKKLGPDSLTVHSLAIKRSSKLNQWIEKNGCEMLKNTDSTMKIAADTAKELELLPYYLYRQKNIAGNFENVGYAMPGKYGIYNILIMEEKQTIMALGAGAVTKHVSEEGVITRCDNVKDVRTYMERIDEMIEKKRNLGS